MYILNIASAIKKMAVNELRDFICENHYIQIGFVKESSYYSMKRLICKGLLLLATKLIEKIVDPCNAKEHYQPFIRKKNTKSVKRLKIITQQPKTFESSNIVDIKSVFIEYTRTSHKI